MSTVQLRIAQSWPAIARCLPFAVFMVLLALRGSLEGHVDTRWLYPVQAGASAVAVALLWRQFSELHRTPSSASRAPGPGWRNAGVAVALGLLVTAIWVWLDADWMRMGGSATTFVPTDPAGRLQVELIAVRLLGACLLVPVIEELFWRSFLMRWFDGPDFLALPPKQASLLAWLSSSFVFALAHDRWLAGLIAGLLFAWLYRQTGRLWYPIVAHAVANLALGAYVVQQRAWQYW